jgi:hypothetical protein
MFFLLRAAFWMSVVMVLMPTGQTKSTPEEGKISAADAFSAATATASDMSQFCERRPEACVAGANAAALFGQRAQAGAKMVYDFLTEQRSPNETGSIPRNADKNVEKAAVRPAVASGKPSQHTLKPSDLATPWRTPQPRQEAAAKRPAA